MRKAILALGVLALLVVAAVVLLPSLLHLDSYRADLADQVTRATGRSVRIDGPIGLSIFPRLELDVAGVGLGNLPGRKPAEMASARSIRVALKLLPLLSGEIAVDRFVLDRPVIALEVDATGKANWLFGETAKGSESGGGGASALERFSQLRLEDVRLVDGTVSYVDRRSGTEQRASAINLALSLAGLDAPLDAKGDLEFQGRKIGLDADVARPRDCLDGKATPVRAGVATDLVTLDFDGEVTCRADLALRGAADLKIPSAKDLAAWAGTKSVVLGAVRLRGKVTVADRKASFTDASVAIGDLRAGGDVRFDFGGTRRRLDGRLDIEDLDLRPYLSNGKEAAETTGTGWSQAPIDLSSLRAADAAFDVTVRSLEVNRLNLGKAALHAKLTDGRLAIDLPEVSLYGGSGRATFQLDGSADDSVGLQVELHATGVQVEPLMRVAADTSRVSGAADVNLAAGARGASSRDLIGNLAGKGSLQVNNGVIRGIDLGAMVMRVATAFQAGDPNAKTEFSEMGGTFTINGGVLRNSDMSMTSPLLVVAGAGTVDFRSRHVDYRLTPKVVAPVLSQLTGGLGVAVPVLIRGPWDNLRYEPDLVGIVTQVPKAVLGTAEDVTKIPGRIWKDATRKPSGAAPDAAPSEPKPSNPLKRLFGR